MKTKTIVFICAFLFTFLNASLLSSDLSRLEYKLIKTAFMNGYARALDLEVQKIEMLKNDSDAMKKHVAYKTDQYMLEVIELNREIKE